MRDRRGDEDVKAVLYHALDDLLFRPRSVFQLATGRSITIHQPLDAAVDVLQKDRVRTGPSAPDSTEERTHIEEREREAGDHKEADPQILGDECQPHEVEATMGHIQENRWESIDGNPGQRDVNDEQHEGGNPSPIQEGTRSIGGMQEASGTIGSDGCYAD